MTQEAPRVLALPDDDREPSLPPADELVDLTLAVAKLVSAGAALVWLMLAQRSRFGADLAYVTLADLAAVTTKTRQQAKRHLGELVGCGLVTIVESTDGRKGGYTLRVEDAAALVTPGVPHAARGDPQRPLLGDTDAEPNVTKNPPSPLRLSPPPIIDHRARALTHHGQGQDHREAPTKLRETDEHDGDRRDVSAESDVSEQRLANEIRRRQREAKSHLQAAPGDARTLRAMLGEVLPPADAEEREKAALQHQTICHAIRRIVADPEMPDGLVCDVAELVVSGALEQRHVDRILRQLAKRSAIANRGGYFRACIDAECDKRNIPKPKPPKP